MCFSTSASFGAAAVLCLAGIVSVKQVHSSSQLLFAAIPFLFSIQQFIEGFVWLSLTDPRFACLEQVATHAFLVFAQVIWPLMIPLSILLLEKDPVRQQLLKVITFMGAGVSIYLAVCLYAFPVSAEIDSRHINYSLNFPAQWVWLSGICYFLATVAAPMLAGNRSISALGIAILISYIITKILFSNYLISVWCFFAAAISGVILYIMVMMNKPVEVEAQLN